MPQRQATKSPAPRPGRGDPESSALFNLPYWRFARRGGASVALLTADARSVLPLEPALIAVGSLALNLDGGEIWDNRAEFKPLNR